MSENTDYCQVAIAVISSPSTNNNTSQIFIPTSCEFNIIHNESFTPSSRAPPIVTDVCVGGQNGVRNTSTTTKTRENELPNENQKHFFQLGEKRNFLNNSMSEDSNRTVKSQLFSFEITSKDEENLHSPTNTDNHRDIDTLSDAGTYIIEDDEFEQKTNSSFKRYGNQSHGTFDIHGLISSTTHTIHRPIVDSNILNDDLSLSSSNSSLHSFNEDENMSENKSILQQEQSTPPQKQIKPPEAFVISPTLATKPFPITNASRRKIEVPLKSKLPTKSKDPNLESSVSARSNQNSFYLQKQSLSLKPSIRPHTATNDQASSFQRNSNSLYQRPTTSSVSHQHSNLTPSTSKPLSRQPLKLLPSTPISTMNSNNQTNRAVELRRARAQAKIEELSQRTKKQSYKPSPQIDIMSASWHSNASNPNKKDFTNLRTTASKVTAPKQQDLSTTRTISSSLYHRSSSASSNPPEGRHDQQYAQMSKSTYSIDEDRCDSLRDDGQRLAIKLIQLSSGILEKLKPNDDVSVRELEQLVDQLQTVNRTLTSIDASLTGPTNGNTFA